MRIPFEQDGSVNHMLQPRPLSGIHNPQYVAPELWNCSSGNDKVVFDGFAVDLWAAGVMLLAMLLGNDALFVAPVPEDRAFHQISVHGHLKKFVTAYHQRLSRASIISDDALDLIQQMLRIDSNDRLTLAEVKQHPWVLCTSSAL